MKDSSSKKQDHFTKIAEKICVIFGAIGGFILKGAWHGMKGVHFKNPFTYRVILGVICACYLSLHFNYFHLRVLNWMLPSVFSKNFLYFIVNEITDFAHFAVMILCIFVWILFFLGIFDFLKKQKYQNGLNRLGLRNATGETPQIVGHYATDEFVTTIRVRSPAIGIEQYKARKPDLEAAFGEIIQRIEVSPKDRQVIEIGMTKRELPTLVYYRDCVNSLKESYSFIAGESLKGLIIQNLRALPHMLIAGSSGGGKTYFFNQVVISLMQTSRHIQFYLLDLKSGIGTAELKDLPNVKVAKTEEDALLCLRLLNEEMKSRFEYLEKNKFKVIEPKRDKKDIIVVGVDEASVLYTKDSIDKERNETIKEARALTENIAKLGRAAGLHLILATQKVTNDTIDTRIQENIGGKICFKTETLQGSNTVLGNKQAFELSEFKGRAIWAHGSSFVEVQTPYIPDDELEAEVKRLAIQLAEDSEFLFQEMFNYKNIAHKEVSKFILSQNAV